jgi:GxxExxY protein
MSEPWGYQHTKITERIIACSFKVHSHFKNGYPEQIYQKALAVEMSNAGLSFIRECERDIVFEGVLLGTRRVDFLVENCVPVELKAVSALDDSHLAQAINYLELFELEIGLLINFGEKSLRFRRLVNNKLKPKDNLN